MTEFQKKIGRNSFFDLFVSCWFLIPICVGFCCWFYYSSYYATLGIPVVYNYIDSLVFFFESLLMIDFREYTPKNIGVFVLVILLPAVGLSFIKILTFKKKVSIRIKIPKKFNYIYDFLFILMILGFFSYFFEAMLVGSQFTGFLLLLVFFLAVLLFFEVDQSDDKSGGYAIPIMLVTLLGFSIPHVFYKFGKIDAMIAIENNFKGFQLVCVANFPSENMLKRPPLLFCGKLLLMNADRVCIKDFKLEAPFCSPKDRYEISYYPR